METQALNTPEPLGKFSAPFLIHDFLEEKAKTSKDNVAIEFNGRKTTYFDLNARSNKIAHYLKLMNLPKGSVIAIMAERSEELIYSILGCLKSGHCYLPINQGIPRSRNQYILNSSNAVLCLYGDKYEGEFSSQFSSKENIKNIISAPHLGSHNLNLELSDKTAAYLLYTSGSTGVPKGVMQTHRTLVNLVRSQIQQDQITQPYRTLQFTPATFDVSIQEMTTAWATGSTLVMMSDEQKEDLSQLPEIIIQQNVERLFLPPAVFGWVADHVVEFNKSMPVLRQVIVAGEALQVSVNMAQFLSAHPSCELWNHYGPTETHVATTHRVDTYVSGHCPPIGKPVLNTQCLILDDNQNTCAGGEQGELWVKGAGIALGYINADEQTMSRFSTAEDGQPMYRTGDRVSKDPDGNLVFHGRKDDQVQIRGFRVELGEIEQALTSISSISQAVVVYGGKEDSFGLCSFIKQTAPKRDLNNIRAILEEQLPSYMMPDSLVEVSDFPLNQNGKVDKKALVIRHFESSGSAQFLATETEQKLRVIWANLTGSSEDRMGRDSSFFSVGGESILAVKLLDKIQMEFDKSISLESIFLHSTLKDLATHIDSSSNPIAQLPVFITSDQTVFEDQVSFAQSSFWFLNQSGQSQSYNILLPIDVGGSLDVIQLEVALELLVSKFDVFQTGFTLNSAGNLVPTPLRQSFEYRSTSDDLQTIIDREQAHVFDLEAGPLLRVSAVQQNSDSAVLLLSVPHIIADGWSMELVYKELVALYTKAELAPITPKVGFQEFALSQKEWVKKGLLEPSRQYWKTALASLPTVHQIPLDYPRPTIRTFEGDQASVSLQPSLVCEIEQWSSTRGMTLFMTVHAAFSLLLSRLSQAEDLVIGVPAGGRTNSDFSQVVGYLSDLVLLRTEYNPRMRVDTYCEQIKQRNLDALKHQNYPFECVMEELDYSVNPSFNPLFQVMLSVEDQLTKLETEDAIFVPQHYLTQGAKYDLHLRIMKMNDGQISLDLEYDSKLFREDTAQQLVDGVCTLLEGFTENQNSELHALPFAPLSEWKALPKEQPHTQTQNLFTLFSDAVKLSPNSVALEFNSASMSYAELDLYSNQLGAWLQNAGVEKDQHVGIALPRSFELIIAILGVIKAGGVYVPFEESHPDARLSAIAEDADIRILITDGIQKKWAPSAISQVNVDTAIHHGDTQRLHPVERFDDDPLSLIYTSGSTGKPKGVVQTHRTIRNLVEHQSLEDGINESLRTLQFTPIGFDVSIQELATSWKTLSPLVLIEQSEKDELNTFAQCLAEKNIERLFCPPAVLAVLAEQHDDLNDRLSLKEVIVAGEALILTPAIRRMFLKLDGCQLWNHYGPTETHVVTTYRVNTNSDGEFPPIGSPISHSSLFVLNASGLPCSKGETGELWVGGDCLAKGYHQRDEETQARFQHHDYAGQRLYRTGDLVRQSSCGALEYIGRQDTQVKIRGYRIELSGVESTLLNLPYVSEARVIAQPRTAHDKQLIAYVVLSNSEANESLIIPSLHAELSEQLPSYMLPHSIISVPSFPLTTNGKLDIAKLPDPKEALLSTAEEGELTPALIQMKAIWADVLEMSPSNFSIIDPFFSLGGHSLQAVRLVNRVVREYKKDVSLRDFFQNSSVEKLSRFLEDRSESALVGLTIPKRNIQLPIPLTPQQEKLWFVWKLEGGLKEYNQQLVIRDPQCLNRKAVESLFNQLVMANPALRTQFYQDKGEWFQKAISSVSLELDWESVSTILPKDLNAMSLSEKETEFDLTKQIGLKVKVLETSEANNIWILTLSHLIFDGASAAVLLEDISRLAQDKHLSKDKDYFDYAQWVQLISQPVEEAGLTFWKQHLKGTPDLFHLPLDLARPSNPCFSAESVPIEINPQLLEKLREAAAMHDLTLHMLIHGTLSLTLSMYAGVTDVVLGIPVANRESEALNDVIGFFANTIAVRTDCSREQSLNDFWTQIRSNASLVQQYQSVPFDKVVEACNPVRSRSHSPIFQVLFSMNSVNHASKESPFELMTEAMAEQHSVLDLIVNLVEDEQHCHGHFTYQKALFTQSSMVRLAQSWVDMLEMMALMVSQKQETIPLHDLPLVEGSLIGQHPQSKRLNAPDLKASKASSQTVLCDFKEQVRQRGQAVALNYEIDNQLFSISYIRLNELSDTLASVLSADGMKAGDMVVVHVQRDPLTVIAQLALFKIGAVYLPVEESTPAERQAVIIEESRAQWQIQFSANDIAAKGVKTKFISLPQLSAMKVLDFTPHTLSAETSAYAIYTSGSTGKPKGVLVGHGGLANTIRSLVSEYHLHDNARVLQNVPLGFDVSISEVWQALCSGASLHIVGKDALVPGKPLSQTLITHKITHLSIVPTALDVIEPHKDMALESLIVGGEVTSKALIERWLPFCRYFVAYGPTECSICCFTQEYDPNTSIYSIGNIVPNMQARVLDDYDQPVIPGAIGELCISGVGLAKGYLNRPELTNQRFFEWEDGFTYYRSGDLVRVLGDGTIEFHGRDDHQVKIRGQRVELTEIESAISRVESVRACAVTYESHHGAHQLVAYIVLSDRQDLNAASFDEIKSVTENELPSYMRPNHVIALEYLPFTASGKLDKNQLPSPDMGVKATAIQLPTNEIETSLLSLWSELLSLPSEQISTDESFFSVGGHSLLLIKLINEIEVRYGMSMSTSFAYENNTIVQMAVAIEGANYSSQTKDDSTEEMEW